MNEDFKDKLLRFAGGGYLEMGDGYVSADGTHAVDPNSTSRYWMVVSDAYTYAIFLMRDGVLRRTDDTQEG